MLYARSEDEVKGWRQQPNAEITLLDVVRNAKPSVLIGVSGQGGAFTEQAVREMAKYVDRPIIFPLSNPTSRSEATPQDLMNWTEGRALIGTEARLSRCAWEEKRFTSRRPITHTFSPGWRWESWRRKREG